MGSPSLASLSPGKPPSGSRMLRGVLPTQKTVDSTPGWPISGLSGEAPPRGRLLRRRSAATLRPFAPDRRILDQRTRLDLGSIRSRPSDLDPAVWIHAYRFSLGILLKRPWGLSDLTRGPAPFKNNYVEVLVLTF